MARVTAVTLALLLCLLPMSLLGQEADTLTAARVRPSGELPVIKPAEGVYLPGQAVREAQVAGILRQFTGVQVKDYGGVGGLKTVNVRSLGSEHVGIFLDGIQVDNAQNMQVDLGRFSTEGLGTVSLYNAQKAVRLQTAKESAAGAAVHLDTERPRPVGGRGGQARLRSGYFGTVNPSLRWDRDWGPVALRAGAEFLTANGKYKYPFFDTTLVRENGDIRSLRLEAQVFGTLPAGEWRLRLYGYGSERGFPGPVIRRATGFPFSAERQADQDAFLQGSWTQTWSDRYATALRFKLSDNYTHFDTHPEKNPMAIPYDLHYRQRSAYLSLAQSWTLPGPWSADFAADLQRNGLDSDVGQFVTPRRTGVIGALSARYAGDKLRGAAHLAWLGAWDVLKTPQAGGWSGEDGFRDAWMPSMSLTYSPCEWLEADVFAKRTFRLPSFNDLYYSQMGNARLKSESATQFGADLRGEWALRRDRRKQWTLKARLSPYYNRVDDKIVAIPTSSQFRWTMLNIGKVDVTGLDAKAESDFRDGTLGWRVSLRYSFQQALDHSDPEGMTFGNQIPYIPLHSGSAAWSLICGPWSLCGDTVLTGGRWSRTANTPDYYLEPWSETDLSMARRFDLRTRAGGASPSSLTLGLSANNLFNRHYQIVQGYPMPGFNLMFSVEYAW